MTKFTLPKRVDAELATSGVDFAIQDEHGQEWGTYKLAWLDTESQRGRAKIERFRKRYASQLKSKAMTEDQYFIRLMVDNYILDWKLPKEMTGGKVLPYSAESAFELLSQEETQWLAATLINKATDITNFNVITDADGESVTPEKN